MRITPEVPIKYYEALSIMQSSEWAKVASCKRYKTRLFNHAIGREKGIP